MIRKFIDWWNQKPVHEDEDTEQEEKYQQKEEEFHYETTLNLDLKRLINLFKSDFPFHAIEKLVTREKFNKVSFRTKNISKEIVRETVPLYSLKWCRSDRDLRIDWDSYRSRVYDDVDYWEANYEEYKELYKPHHTEYGENVIKALLEEVEINYKNQYYYYIFTKYEDSIHIVYNTLKDAKEQNGEISEELFQKSTIIIEKFAKAMNKKKEEIEHIEKLQQEAVSKSLIDRLDNEIMYMDKFTEVQ